VRWQHPRGRTLQPEDFIPLAEETGLIRPLTRWVLAAAVRQCATWRRDGLELVVAANLSARDLNDPELLDFVVMLLAEHDLPPSSLELEITERAVMSDPAAAIELVTELHRLGVRFAIDDFIMGRSLTALLGRLQVQQIKIDQWSDADVLAGPKGGSTIDSIIELAHGLNLEVVAEGIESEPALEALRQRGCDYGQGFCLSRPMAAAHIGGWVADRRGE
jgi:diguanylate cyclase